MNYDPQPIETSVIELSPEILSLTEWLAENTHDIWAAQRLADGWSWGPERNDARQETPCLVPYADLPDSEKQYDRKAALATLRAIVALGYQIVPHNPVVWLRRAENRVQRQHLDRWNEELRRAFPVSSTTQITVCDVFGGFTADERQRIVLGVQWQTSESFGSHIVKLGTKQQVGKDYDGWRRCVMGRGVGSHVLLSLGFHPLDEDRVAVVYEDAYRLFGTDTATESPKWLELAADWAVRDSRPDVLSVERVLIQVFGELDRCLYQGAREDAARPGEFYRKEVTKPPKSGGPSANERWETDEFVQLRRDAIWLITSRDKPCDPQPPRYLDPVDYLNWALEFGHIPPTLVGRAHGDLHGRNILVGVIRGEVDQPVVIDYGDMAEDNLPVWDFVKLESELKTRILPDLFSQPAARETLARAAPRVRPAPRTQDASTGWGHSPRLLETAACADRLEFAFQFESLLDQLTTRVISRHDAETSLPADQRRITGHPAIDKALCLIYRIRQEAALRLGYRRNRSWLWHDEYYLALCMYGVLKAKWDIERPQLEWSLVSAGVAAASLSSAQQIQSLCESPLPASPKLSRDVASHLVPLNWAHRLWTEHRYAEACQLLEQARQRFPAAVTLNAEYALCLAAAGKLDEATRQVDQLRPLCPVFGDEETLCRLGRIFKDLGDRAWSNDPDQPDHATFVAGRHSGWQLYRSALRLYREAFEIRHDYFPGINAATLAALQGEHREAERLAEGVLKSCHETDVDHPDERFWIYATEGEASLLVGRDREALQFYRNALSALFPANKPGMVQPMYNQLCRLYWCLGPATVQGVVDLLEQRGALNDIQRGPFLNCGRR
jgi:ryanodine receptor 2